MEFLNPGFLYGFGILAVPVLIHLFNFRRYRKEYFSNVRFLSQIQLETRKRSRLRQLLVLAARMLALASLVLAFAQPFIPSPLPGSRQAGNRAISVYIDNSYSMEAVGPEGRLLDIARKKAGEVVSAYKSSDIFQLLTNDFEGKHAQFVNREEFLGMLREIKISHSTVSLRQVLSRQNDLFLQQKECSHTSFLISDFQKTTSGFKDLKPDSATNVVIVPVEAVKQNNLFVDSIWFSSPVHRPGQPVKLIARVSNCGSEKIEKSPLRLSINNIQKSVTSFNSDPYKTTDITLPYTEDKSGFQYGKLELSDYPVTYDDMFYFTYTITNEINVLSIYGKSPNPYLKSLFASDSVFKYNSFPANQVDYGSFSYQNLIIISGMDELASGLASELKSFLERGGSVCIFPPEKIMNESYKVFLNSVGSSAYGNPDTLKQRISTLDAENELFKDVFEKDATGKVRMPENADLPSVYKYYPISGNSKNPSYILMRMQNGLPFLTSTGVGKGKMYLCASALDPAFTNFQRHILFVPVMYRMTFLSETSARLYFITGRNEPVDLRTDSVTEKDIVKIMKWNSPYEFIPELRNSGQQVQVLIHDQISEAGWYLVYRGKKQIHALAYNYDRKESDIRCFSAKEIEGELKKYSLRNFIILKPSGLPFSRQVERLNMGFPLWKWFLVLTLAFIAAEIVLIRFMRK